MLAGGAPIPTGRKTSCPEQAISVLQLGAVVAMVVGLPLVVTVVAKIVVDVLEATRVVSIKVNEAEVIVLVLSDVKVNVELFTVIVETLLSTDTKVETVCRGKVATIDSVTMLSMVVVGTVMICVVVDSGSSVVLVNGAKVVSGSRVETVTEGNLVGNG
jgi:hypothetical protein